METILGFSARLYEVRQLSWRPAQVNPHHFFLRDSEERHRYHPQISGRASTTRTHPWRPVRGRSLYKGDRCTSRPLSSNIRRRPHLRTPREETLPTRSEEEQTVVMICRPNSKMMWCWLYVVHICRHCIIVTKPNI